MDSYIECPSPRIEVMAPMSNPCEGESLPKVMLVDDDEDVREILGETLKSQCFEVELCTSGTQAIKSISEDIRVVVLDMMMPDMDGTETFRELQKKHPGLPVVFYSAYRNMLNTRELDQYKPYGMVEKGSPGSRQRVVELVKRAVQAG